MTRTDHSPWLDVELTEEEEAAYLQAHPELQAELQLQMLLDGELEPEQADAVRAALVESSELQQRLDELLMLEAVMGQVRRPAQVSELHQASRGRPKRKGPGYLWSLIPLAAAAGVLLAISGGFEHEPPIPVGGLAIETISSQTKTRSVYASVGDGIRMSAPTGALTPTLRLYRDRDGLVRECPGHPACRVSDGEISLDHTFEEPGTYHVLWILSKEPLPPSRGTVEEDADLVDARAVKHEIETIEVRAR